MILFGPIFSKSEAVEITHLLRKIKNPAKAVQFR